MSKPQETPAFPLNSLYETLTYSLVTVFEARLSALQKKK